MKTIRITRKQSVSYNDFYECIKNDINGLMITINTSEPIKHQIDGLKETGGFVFSFTDNQVYDLLFNTSKSNETYDLYKIVSNSNEINGYAKRELIDNAFIYFRSYSKRSSVWSVKLIDDYKNLKSIVSSPIARDQLIYSLEKYPNINAANEIQKFDQFICLLYRYSRKNIEIDRLYEHLLKEMRIDKQVALKLCEKVENGFNLLDVYNHKFRNN